MKLTYLTNNRLPTEKAYGIQISKMCESFALQNIDVNLVMPIRKNLSGLDLFEFYNIRRNFKTTNLYSPDFYFPGKLDSVAFLIKDFISTFVMFFYAMREKADVIFSRNELPLYFLSFFRKNLVFEAHKFSSRRFGFYRRFKRANLKIVAISKGIRDEFINFGIDPKRVLIANDGVDLEEFSISEDREECRNRLNLPMDKKIIGYVGQLKTMGVEKGIGNLIQAMSDLQTNHPDLLAVIIGGSDEDVRHYKFFAKEKNIDSQILFLGQKKHKDIPFYLKAFNVFVMPFPNRPHYALYMSPLKLFEYMASGRPIVASDLPSIREVLNEGNAIIVEPNSIRALADGIKKASYDSDFSDRISIKALEDVREYTWNKRAEKIKDFINEN